VVWLRAVTGGGGTLRKESMKRILVVFSGNHIGGAEIVFRDFMQTVEDPSLEFFAVCADEKMKRFLMECGLRQEHIVVSSSFGQVGAKKQGGWRGLLLKIWKLWRVIWGRIIVRGLAHRWDIHLLYGKNTADVLYMPRGKRQSILHVHDILERGDWIARYVQRRQDIGIFVCVSQAVKTSLMELGIPAEKLRVVYNGITPVKIREKPQKNPSLMVWVGNIEPRKDPMEFVMLFDLLRQRDPSLEGLMIYKVADETLLRQLREFIREKHLAVRLVQGLLRDEVLEVMSGALCLVMTSLQDPLPTVILEAYAVGTPVIGRACSGIVEMVEDGKTGVLYTSREDLATRWPKVRDMLGDVAGEVAGHMEKLLRERFHPETKKRVMVALFKGEAVVNEVNNTHREAEL